MESHAVDGFEWCVHQLLFWEPNARKKGRILRFAHHLTMHAIFVLMVVSHTVYPAFWLQTLLLGAWVLIWLQHIVANGCVSSKVEQRLIGDNESFVDPLLEMFDVTPSKEISVAVVVLGSTCIVTLLGLEWTARAIHLARSFVARVLEHYGHA